MRIFDGHQDGWWYLFGYLWKLMKSSKSRKSNFLCSSDTIRAWAGFSTGYITENFCQTKRPPSILLSSIDCVEPSLSAVTCQKRTAHCCCSGSGSAKF